MLKSGKNVNAESSIPQMVITSTEGEDEEITLTEMNGISEDAEFTGEKDKQIVPVHPCPISDVDTSVMKPSESIYEVIEPKDRPLEEQISNEFYSSRNSEVCETPKCETPKDTDSFFARSKAFFKDDIKPHFSFPKFSFGTKDQKKISKDSLSKEDKRTEDKLKVGEYSVAAAEELNYVDHIVEHYRKLEEDTFRNGMEPSTSEAYNQGLSHTIDDLNIESKPVSLAPEEPIELLPKELGKQTNKKQTKTSDKFMCSKRASTPDSLYDTCCIRLAVLLRNKAVEIATDKALPPKKPPKPSAEALAKARAEIAARKLKEYQSQPHSFGEDMEYRFDNLRYADEDTESSTDYKDLDNIGLVSNPECYGIAIKTADKFQFEDDDDDPHEIFRAPSTCSSYYTADTVTLKDDYSSDTLETVSLGSYESIVCRPLSSENKSEVSSPTSFVSCGQGTTSSSTSQSTSKKKVPPPIPPKPSILDTYKCSKSIPSLPQSSSSDVSRCVNTLSLSPRPVLRSTGSPGGIKKRPLTIASVKETDFSEYSKTKSFSSLPKRPVLNTIVRNTTLEKVQKLPSDSSSSVMKSISGAKTLPSKSKIDSSYISVPLKPPPPPRPPPPTISSGSSTKTTNEQIQSEEIIPPPRRIPVKYHTVPPRPTPPTKKPTLPIKPVLSPPPRPPPPLCKESLQTDDNTIILTENAVIDAEPVNFIEKLSSNENKFSEGLDILEKIPSSAHVERNENVASSLKDDLALIAHLDTPQPPPRGRRKRARTVESVSREKEIFEVKRRSQSLTDLDIEKRVASLQAPHIKIPDPKSLYTTVNKDRTKINLLHIEKDEGRRSPSVESMSNRPLPAPPPPPRRSKSHSTSRRSKSDERPHSADRPRSPNIDIGKAVSMPNEINSEIIDIKPPLRRNKDESKRIFFSLRGKGKIKKLDMDNKFHTIEKVKPHMDGYMIPIRPERKPKPTQPVVHFDENANIADVPFLDTTLSNKCPISSSSPPPLPLNSPPQVTPPPLSFTSSPQITPSPPPLPLTSPPRITPSPSRNTPPPLPSRHRGRSMHCDRTSPSEFNGSTKLQRSLSERPCKKSHSSWYDEVDAVRNGSSSKGETDSWEKLDWTSQDALQLQSQENYIAKKVPPRAKKARQTSMFYVDVHEEIPRVPSTTPSLMEDKETSPLRLDLSEKSVQTSLETLSIDRSSRAEESDDTDELLDLAQTLQNELKTIITRHKTATADDNQSDEDSPVVSDQSAIAYDSPTMAERHSSLIHTDVLPNDSTSSVSEIYQLSSSDESEAECVGGESSNVSATYQAKKKKKIFYIAQEIMVSEKAFVDCLKLLNVDFRTFVNEASKQKGVAVVPEEVLNQILNHLPQLQHLNENLLMELQDRIKNWEKFNKIADVIVKMGPFLKLYSWYIQDFETTVSLLEEAKKKHVLFAQVVKEFEQSPRCKRLFLNHYMLKPVQRIPQYRLLLQEYLHHLSEDCEDYEHTKEALQIVSDVANHANESMKHGDNFQKLISIQSSILGHKEIIKPGRKFIKEGELMKLSRKGMQPRWFVLLNDMLLYLTQVQQGLYRVNHELMLAGMKVAIPIQPDYQNEFSIISVTRSFTLAAKSQEERQEWIVALTKAIEENASKRSTFTAIRLQQNTQRSSENVAEGSFELGRQAPVWIPDTRVTMCQLCTSEFTVTFRRHHCRACGKVVCSVCSSNRISLPYLGNRIARVCDECYVKLGQGSSACTESGDTDSDNQQLALKAHLRTDQKHIRKPKRHLPSVLKEVCANDQGSTISGYIYKRNSHKSWKRNWFVIKDKVLYEYKASEDVAALRSIPLLGFQINSFIEPLEGIDSSLLFELTHPGQAPIVFHAETPGSAERWIKALREATVLE